MTARKWNNSPYALAEGGTPCDVKGATANGLKINVVGAFEDGAQIGVFNNSQTAVFTAGYSTHNSETPSAYFFSNSADYTVAQDANGEAKLISRYYTVTWKNSDGTVLKTDTVEYQQTPAYTGKTPTKEGNAQYTYIFSGWTPAVAAVTGDATYTATYDAEVNAYTIQWLNGDGDVLKMESVNYGVVPSYTGETPTKAEDNAYTYTFAGWDKEIAAVTGDATYTATFTKTEKPQDWQSVTIADTM